MQVSCLNTASSSESLSCRRAKVLSISQKTKSDGSKDKQGQLRFSLYSCKKLLEATSKALMRLENSRTWRIVSAAISLPNSCIKSPRLSDLNTSLEMQHQDKNTGQWIVESSFQMSRWQCWLRTYSWFYRYQSFPRLIRKNAGEQRSNLEKCHQRFRLKNFITVRYRHHWK